MSSGILALALVSSLWGPPSPDVRGALWYDAAHRIVARITATRLTPEAAAAVRDLLGGQDLADAALWADQIRAQRRNTGPLHYVNIPLEADAYLPAEHCPGGQCIIAAIERERHVLADSTASPALRAEALRFLIHLVADLHQPLHVADHGDRGGNLTQVQFFGSGTNLHQVWDGQMLEQRGWDEAQCLEHLVHQMASLDLAGMERGSVVDWAMEGHRLAAAEAYRLPRNRRLSAAYLDANLPAVDLALIRAGVRLAVVLNQALGAYRAGDRPTAAPGVYSDLEAAGHVGETATIVGTVITVYRSRAGNVYLNFGADYPQQTFSAAVLDPRDPRFRDLDRLAGRRVGVTGLVKRYQGRVEIVVTKPEQITVMP